jgi:glutathione S-transferase
MARLWLLWKGSAHPSAWLDLHSSHPNAALHPIGRISIFEDDGFPLYETQAILRYIDRVLPTPTLTPKDPKRAARMDQVMNINDWYLFQGVANVILFQRVVAPRELRPERRRHRGSNAEVASGI